MLSICRASRIIINTAKTNRNIFLQNSNKLCYFRQETSNKTLGFHYGISLQKRTFFGPWKIIGNEELRIEDDVSPQFSLIYKSKLNRYLWLVQIVTGTLSVLFGIILLLSEKLKFKYFSEVATGGKVRTEEDEIYIILVAFVVMVLGLQYFLARMPIRIYNFPQKKKYIMVFYGNIPLTKKTVTAKVGELTEASIENSFLPWRQSKFFLKSGHNQKVVYLMENYFKRPADLYIMLGIQKDPDVIDEEET